MRIREAMSADPDAKSLFLGAVELAEDEQEAFLAAAAVPDAVREEARRLVQAHARAGRIFEGAPVLGPLSPLSTEAQPGPGSVIGPYVLERCLGEGGFGRVHLARQEAPVRRHVAVKILKSSFVPDSVLRRFESEREVLAFLDHPSIARILDAGMTQEGRPFVVMELVDGPSITAYCDDHRLGIQDRIRLLIEVGRAIEHAHKKGVIHRDLKPSNILVQEVDGRPQPKIIDFGIAKVFGGALLARGLETRGGLVLGTPHTMAPEQLRGGADVDTRADVHGLGAVLYELLSGVPLRDAAAAQAILAAEDPRSMPPPLAPSARVAALGPAADPVAAARGVDPARLVRSLRGDPDWICERAVHADRDQRYPSVSSLLADLERHLRHEPLETSPPQRLYRLRKLYRRHRAALLAGAVVLAALLAGLGLSISGRVAAERERRHAQDQREESEAVLDVLIWALSAASPRDHGRNVTLLEVVERADPAIAERLAARPEAEARVRLALGQTLFHLGRTEDARQAFARARERLESRPGTDPGLWSDARMSLARCDLESYPVAAEAGLLEAMAVLSSSELRRKLRIRRLIGEARERQGDAEGALRIAREVLEARRAALGAGDLDTLDSEVELGFLLLARGELEAAGPHFERTVALLDARHGPGHPDAFAPRRGLAELQGRGGEHARAAELFAGLLADAERALGPEHPETIGIRNGLAVNHASVGRLDEARLLFQTNLEAQERRLGRDHPDTLSTLHNLAVLAGHAGDREEEEGRKRAVLETKRRVFGEGHVETALAELALARCLLARGAHEEARLLLEAADRVFRGALAPGDRRRLEAGALLVQALRALLEPEAASAAEERHRADLEAAGRAGH
jgi:serine/threonine protein kinase